MATQASNPTAPHPAQMVGNAFVEQYYHILHTSPDLVYRFYQDSSVLSRPGPDGKMASVKTMDDINVVILSMDYKECKAEIKTIDAQDSYKGGVVVQVTGWLIVKDNVKRKFTQSFFLAPQDKGYFVLNDIFRYVDEYETVESDAVAVAVNGVTESVTSTPVTPDPEPSHIPEHPMPENTTPEVEVSYGNGEVVHEPSDNGEVSTVEVEVVEAPVHSGQDEVLPVTEPASTVPEDTPKKSYASIVKVMKETTPVHVPTNIRKVAAGAGKVAAKVVGGSAEQGTASPAPASVAPAPSSNNGPISSNLPEEVEGYSIYVKSLPLNASVSEVEEEFKTFGKIRPNGIQVRSTNKQGGGFCFGFVEFESLESVKSALKASPITFGDRQVYIEEKRTSTRVGATGRPRYPPARPGFRNDNFRGRGNFVGGRGYGRNEYGNRGDFSGRRSQSGRGGDGYQRVEHNVGNGKVGRQGGMSQTAVSA